MSQRILVAGVGNVFLGDDGFGVEVARRLESETFPSGVHVADYGIRGIHLAYQLLEGYDALILIDAVQRGFEPGTLFVLEPDFENEESLERNENGFLLDAHGMDPEMLLGTLGDLGGSIGKVIIVGCEPATVEERMGLSDPVVHAVEPAAKLVRELVEKTLETDAGPTEAVAKGGRTMIE